MKSAWLLPFFFVDSNSPEKDLLFPHGPNLAQKPLYLIGTVRKARPGAKPLKYDNETEYTLHVKEISFSYERMGTKIHFEKAAKGNSEMA